NARRVPYSPTQPPESRQLVLIMDPERLPGSEKVVLDRARRGTTRAQARRGTGFKTPGHRRHTAGALDRTGRSLVSTRMRWICEQLQVFTSVRQVHLGSGQSILKDQ